MSTQTSVKTKNRKKQKNTPAIQQAVAPSRDQVAELAKKYWMDRGQSDGLAEQDWLRAEKELGTASN